MGTTSLLLEAIDIVRRDTRTGNLLLDHVSLSIAPGDQLSIVGPTGAGKSVLLRALCMLDPIQSGELRWRGERVLGNDVPKFRSHVIYVAQRPAMLAGSVEDNLRSPMTMKLHAGREFQRDRTLEWLRALYQSGEFLEKSTEDLSGGEAQIVGLLRAIQLEPDVLLLDEPTASLDERTTGAVEQLIRDWNEMCGGDRSVIWVSHDPSQAKRVSNSMIHLEDGKLRAEG